MHNFPALSSSEISIIAYLGSLSPQFRSSTHRRALGDDRDVAAQRVQHAARPELTH
jgi:hypothetical protein